MAQPGVLITVVPGQIDLEVLPGRHVVAHATTAQLPSVAWLVTQTLLFNEKAAAFNAVIVDDEGATLVLDRMRARAVERAGLGAALRLEEDVVWVALQLQLGQTANNVPGLINHMAKALMSHDVSILHYSTYGTEVFLVREESLGAALSCFDGDDLRRRLTFLMGGPANRNHYNHDEEAGAGSPGLPRLRKHAAPGAGEMPSYTLSELDQRLFIVRLKRDYFHEVSRTLLQLFLFDPHYQRHLMAPPPPKNVPLTPELASSRSGEGTEDAFTDPGDGPSPPSGLEADEERRQLAENDCDAHEVLPAAAAAANLGMRFVLGFLEAGEEITLYVDEDDLQLFPEEAVEVCPTPWRAVKLTGRAFALDECGVVSAMSKVDDNVSILSLSTYETTITMVAQEQTTQTLETLSSYLGASVVRSKVPHLQG